MQIYAEEGRVRREESSQRGQFAERRVRREESSQRGEFAERRVRRERKSSQRKVPAEHADERRKEEFAEEGFYKVAQLSQTFSHDLICVTHRHLREVFCALCRNLGKSLCAAVLQLS